MAPTSTKHKTALITGASSGIGKALAFADALQKQFKKMALFSNTWPGNASVDRQCGLQNQVINIGAI